MSNGPYKKAGSTLSETYRRYKEGGKKREPNLSDREKQADDYRKKRALEKYVASLGDSATPEKIKEYKRKLNTGESSY